MRRIICAALAQLAIDEREEIVAGLQVTAAPCLKQAAYGSVCFHQGFLGRADVQLRTTVTSDGIFNR
jgi:hypothetical protein